MYCDYYTILNCKYIRTLSNVPIRLRHNLYDINFEYNMYIWYSTYINILYVSFRDFNIGISGTDSTNFLIADNK